MFYLAWGRRGKPVLKLSSRSDCRLGKGGPQGKGYRRKDKLRPRACKPDRYSLPVLPANMPRLRWERVGGPSLAVYNLPRFNIKSRRLKNTLRVRAFAKINAGLKILGKRPDDYHEIRTIYQTISLHDRLTIGVSKAGKSVTVECDNPAIPTGSGNLVHRACVAWAEARGWRGGIQRS